MAGPSHKQLEKRVGKTMRSTKRLLLLLASTGLFGVAHATEANWIQAGATPDGAHYLIDVNYVTVVGSTTWFWTKLANAPTKNYDVVVARNYVDCEHRDEAFITSQTFYDKKGNDLGTTRQIRTIQVVDGSPMFSFVTAACTISEGLKP